MFMDQLVSTDVYKKLTEYYRREIFGVFYIYNNVTFKMVISIWGWAINEDRWFV